MSSMLEPLLFSRDDEGRCLETFSFSSLKRDGSACFLADENTVKFFCFLGVVDGLGEADRFFDIERSGDGDLPGCRRLESL